MEYLIIYQFVASNHFSEGIQSMMRQYTWFFKKISFKLIISEHINF